MLMAMRQMSVVLTIIGGLWNVCRRMNSSRNFNRTHGNIYGKPKSGRNRDRSGKITARLAAPADLHRPVS